MVKVSLYNCIYIKNSKDYGQKNKNKSKLGMCDEETMCSNK